ncbi:MAG: MBL fold metallo-hydrolase [bacterium]|nr:MBL fold metallo-hydrolase [bacterium]
MKVKTIIVGNLQTNCYIIEKDNKVLIIDPGDDYLLIKEKLKNKEILAVLLTHHHFDHVGALDELVNHYNIKVYDSSNLKEGEKVIDPFKFNVILTKGHTSDSLTYYFVEDKIMFTGDFLFKEEIGRCDLPTGNYNEMLKSIKNIKEYNKDITIYPGHGETSTLENEFKNNKYFT